MKKLKFISLLSLGAALVLTSCGGGGGNVKSGGGSKNKVGMNGWKTNDPKGWFFRENNKSQKDGQTWYM
jgi:hypothetical protein